MINMYCFKNFPWNIGNNEYEMQDITHWMPLPERP